ncbi:Atu4866 domain-containing protein [Teichococcus deserti]|nr:Atu4866 domain-containing protein [Pseudoroseomonas deserti]
MALGRITALAMTALLPGASLAQTAGPQASHPYVGLWVTDDNRVRHRLLPGGRYDEARGSRESAYRGRYEVTGTHIEYWDDTGFTADGDFVDADTLHHGGMVLRRRR